MGDFSKKTKSYKKDRPFSKKTGAFSKKGTVYAKKSGAFTSNITEIFAKATKPFKGYNQVIFQKKDSFSKKVKDFIKGWPGVKYGTGVIYGLGKRYGHSTKYFKPK